VECLARPRGGRSHLFYSPIGLDYPRPRPPRHSTLWSLGDAAYFISDEFHKNHPLGDPDAVARLIEANSPTSILREHLPGLTVIRCKGPAEDKTTFARQRYDLEVWLSSVLQLQLHPEFRDNGDQHLSVFRKESVLPFTFFDQVRGIAFKAVPNSEPCELDNETRQYLKDILRIRTLQDGRLVRQTIVVFPTREAAVHNIDVVSKLGASGVAYIGDDYCLWNPQPVGNWILTDWSKG